MYKSILSALLITSFIFIGANPASAHFGMVIPSDSMVMQGESKTVNIKLSFSHPFEGQGMELVKPKVFFVNANGKKKALLGSLKKTKIMGHTSWETNYKVKRPGVYMFYMEP
ncbi:MAG: DUF4198 domain-containing protein, partial [Desulfobacterales bacterium]|nr:DUF4198 domain-containing protein [Desulfobacterales bacterium]MDX2507984.1 DUF4198 domain-containing protein [Desulfobacterales bacterium]